MLLVLAAAFGIGAGCGGGGGGERGRGVLVVAIDALRHDHTGFGGYDRDTTPGLDALAAEGVVFEQAFSAAPQKIQSHLALLTGCDPNVARRPPLPDGTTLGRLASWYAPDAVPRLARSFLAAGYAAAAFVDHPWLSAVHGFEKGFERYKAFRPDQIHSPLDYGLEGMARPFLRWLGRLPADRDWFAYLTVNELERVWEPTRIDPRWDTYFEPRAELAWLPPVGQATTIFHAVPRPRWLGGAHTMGEYEAKYDGALRRLDLRLARLFDHLRSVDRWADTTVVVVGTFGVSFGESPLLVDTGTFHPVDLHVPLVVKPAAGTGFTPGSRCGDLVSLVDLAPTLLVLEGVKPASGMHGRSFAAALRGRAGAPARELAFASCGVVDGFAVIDERWIYEELEPGSTGYGPLTSSWFGDEEQRHLGEARIALRDRGGAERPLDPTEADEARRLRAAGLEWFEAVDRAQRHLHPVPWDDEPLSPAELAELRRRGLIPADDAWARLGARASDGSDEER